MESIFHNKFEIFRKSGSKHQQTSTISLTEKWMEIGDQIEKHEKKMEQYN